MTIPMSSINNMLPTRERSMRATYPRMLIARKVPAVTKNVVAMVAWVKARNITENVTPVSTE